MMINVRTFKTGLVAIVAALGVSACSTLSDQDRSLLNRASEDASAAKVAAQKAATAATEAARASEAAQRRADEAATLAKQAAKRSERMFNKSLRK